RLSLRRDQLRQSAGRLRRRRLLRRRRPSVVGRQPGQPRSRARVLARDQDGGSLHRNGEVGRTKGRPSRAAPSWLLRVRVSHQGLHFPRSRGWLQTLLLIAWLTSTAQSSWNPAGIVVVHLAPIEAACDPASRYPW